ncbi:prepilin peptidase [Candidatus Parcubacteria bacterium]|nr:MAG: prepilin peptidase [Candidatus Parcubacteria bacterium]
MNCLIWRLYKNESLGGRSYCPQCRHQLAWYDNIPLVSFVVLGGRCRYCRQPISWQYPLVELATGFLFLLSFWLHQQTGELNGLVLARDWLVFSVMIVVFVFDWRWYLIPAGLVLPASGVVFLLSWLLGFSWKNLLISGIIGSSFFLIQWVISRGKWIGSGDAYLGWLIGIALGWPYVLGAIFFSYWLGALAALGLLASGRKKLKSQLPLGVFLSIGTIVFLLWGRDIFDWWFGLWAVGYF